MDHMVSPNYTSHDSGDQCLNCFPNIMLTKPGIYFISSSSSSCCHIKFLKGRGVVWAIRKLSSR